MELGVRQASRIYPALFCSAAIHRGAGLESVAILLNHPDMRMLAMHRDALRLCVDIWLLQ
jgi:hypothetical protein